MIKLRRFTALAAAPPLHRLLQFTLSRLSSSSSSATAQPILDYDYYQLDHAPPRHQPPMADAAGSVPVRGVQWAFIGSPIAKRHVYAERISKLLQVPHISMATLVRQELHPHSSLYNQIANAVNRGEIVAEDDILLGLLSKRLEDGYCRAESGFILDGIPRSKIQAEILSQLVEIDLVLNFKCTEHCLAREAAWREKLQTFAVQSKPLEEYYKKRKKLLDFQVSSAPGETWKGLLATLHLHSSL